MTPSASAPKYISYQEVQKHNSRASCWVIVEGQVYDVTSFLEQHPGGVGVVVKNSGKDATYAPVSLRLCTINGIEAEARVQEGVQAHPSARDPLHARPSVTPGTCGPRDNTEGGRGDDGRGEAHTAGSSATASP